MFLELKLYVILLVLIFQIHVTGASNIIAKNSTMDVEHGSNAVLQWTITVDVDSRNPVTCTVRRDSSKSVAMTIVAKGTYNDELGQHVFKIPKVAQDSFNHRLKISPVYTTSNSRDVLTLTILKTKITDSSKLLCTYGQDSSEITLLVYKPISLTQQLESLVVFENLSENKTLTTVLCAYPEPRVTMELTSVKKQLKGRPMPNDCFAYFIPNLHLKSQKQCGEELKLTYQGIKNIIIRSVKLTVKLQPEPPTNAQIVVRNSKCATIRWDGPNIGSCIATLSYDVIASIDVKQIKIYETSSNIVEICDVKVTQKSFKVMIRTRIDTKNSTWIQATLKLDIEINNIMRTVIIACSVLLGFSLILLFAYCCYINKCSVRCRYTKKARLLNQEVDEVELAPLTEQTTSNNKNESTIRKISRKLSMDNMLSDNNSTAVNVTMNNSTNSNTENADDLPNKSNHNTRFYSLQRNIERERKKLEEEEKQQQQEEFILLPRRNTDSHILRDHQSHSLDHHNGPLYDVLPTTNRSSQSTNSTNHSIHDDELEHVLPRRNTDSQLLRDARPAPRVVVDPDPVPLYDVLPISNTQPSYAPPQEHDNHNNSLYDFVPRMNTTSTPNSEPHVKILQTKTTGPGSNGQVYDILPRFDATASITQNIDAQNNIEETIYDVPVKPVEPPTNEVAQYTPFSSHKKGADHYKTPAKKKNEIYENF